MPVAAKVHPQLLARIIQNTFRAASRYVNSDHAYMTCLLRSWVAAGCRFDAWEKSNPEMAWKLRRHLDQRWRAMLFSGRGGRPETRLAGASGFETDAADKANSDEPLAYDLFAMFVVAAAPRAEVGICDREKCRQFYWNRWGHTNKRFCGRKCAQLQTATEGQAKRVRRQWQEKDKRIRRSIREFVNTKPQTSDWRQWVASKAQVSLSYLTRSMRRGNEGSNGVKPSPPQRKYLRKFESGPRSHNRRSRARGLFLR